MGKDKAGEIISKTYWFPDRKRIEEHIQNCFKCIANNPACDQTEGKINLIPKGDKPFDKIHIDHVTISDARAPRKNISRS